MNIIATTLSHLPLSDEQSPIPDFAIKACSNKGRPIENFALQLRYILRYKSIGIHHNVDTYIPPGASKEEVRQISIRNPNPNTGEEVSSDYCTQLSLFYNLKPGNNILVGQGKNKPLFIARIASYPYYQPSMPEDSGFTNPAKEWHFHRIMIDNIKKVPSDFPWKGFLKTIAPYTPL